MRIKIILSVFFAYVLVGMPNILYAGIVDNVVVSIKPIHSLVAGVMKGVGKPYLIVKNAGSPHGYNLKPSDARALANARLVFWVGPQLEKFLEGPIQSLAKRADVVSLMDVKLLVHLGSKNLNMNDKNDDDNAHIWLDPENAKIIVNAVAVALGEKDPEHKANYLKNAAQLRERLDILIGQIAQQIKPVKLQNYMVFHDAYGYFEHRFGLKSQGFIALNPDRSPGAKRLKRLRELVVSKKVKCIFSEPQFNPKLARVIAQGSDVAISVLDPIGAKLEAGPDLYFKLLNNITTSLVRCLAR